MLRDVKWPITNNSLGITLLMQKYRLKPVKLYYLWHFSQIKLHNYMNKCVFFKDKLLTKWLKMQFKAG